MQTDWEAPLKRLNTRGLSWAAYTRACSLLLVSSTCLSCFKSGPFLGQVGEDARSQRSQTALAAGTSTAPETATAAVSSQSTTTQTLSASLDSTDAGAGGGAAVSVSFPPGSLAIDTTVTIEKGVQVANAVTSTQLGLGDAATLQLGVPVAITASAGQDAVKAFTVALSLPSGSGLALADQYANLLVVYKATLRNEGITVVGTIPRDKLTLIDGKVQFETNYFGAYQTVITAAPVTAVAQVTVPPSVISLSASTALPALAITSRTPFATKQGSTVQLTGKNFRPSMVLAFGGKPVRNLAVASDVSASFVVPDGAAVGLTLLTAEQDGTSQSVALAYAGTAGDLPFITLPATSVCDGTKFYDANGQIQTGSRNCAQPDLSLLTAANIRSGVTINGVTGTAAAPAAAANCASDGATGCLATAAYPAAAATGLAAKVVSGQTVAGIPGTAAASPSMCAADGDINCLASSSYKAAATAGLAAKVLTGQTVAGVSGTAIPAPSSCTSDGATAAYPATLLSGLASKVLSSNVVAGISGNVTLPSASSVLTGTNFGAAGTAFSGTLTLPVASKVRVSNGSFGIGGNGTSPSLLDCTSDGQTGCVTVVAFPAASLAGFNATQIQNGTTVAGISGTLPSCTSDGQQNCLTSAVFKAANVTGITSWDIRTGQTLGGISGSLKVNCRDKVTTSRFNHDSAVSSLTNTATTSGTAFDFWDTTNDYLGYGTSRVSAWSPATDCDAGGWSDVTTNNAGSSTVTCASSPTNCQFKDNNSGLIVSKMLGTTYSWSAAMNACYNSSVGSFSSGTWRLPTHKEILTLYTHGIVSIGNSSFFTQAQLQNATGFWSATTDAEIGGAYAILAYLASGGSSNVTKATTANAFCVR